MACWPSLVCIWWVFKNLLLCQNLIKFKMAAFLLGKENGLWSVLTKLHITLTASTFEAPQTPKKIEMKISFEEKICLLIHRTYGGNIPSVILKILLFSILHTGVLRSPTCSKRFWTLIMKAEWNSAGTQSLPLWRPRVPWKFSCLRWEFVWMRRRMASFLKRPAPECHVLKSWPTLGWQDRLGNVIFIYLFFIVHCTKITSWQVKLSWIKSQ